MPLPSSGNPISLAQVNTELGNNTTTEISLNQSTVRSLFQKTTPNTAIAMSDGWGKSACPPYGTYLTSYCSGYTLYNRYANGSCGYYDQVAEYNSATCGYCDPYGTYVGYYCSGTTKYDEYANGSCGTYSSFAESNSCDCGGSGPSYGTETGYWYCDGYTKMIEKICGCFCTYFDSEPNSGDCGYNPPACNASVDCDCYCNHISSSAYSNDGSSITNHEGQQKGSDSQYGVENFAGYVGQCSTSGGTSTYLFCNGGYAPWTMYKAIVNTASNCSAEAETSSMQC